MKLARVGNPGQEKPTIIDKDNNIILSSGSDLNDEIIEKIKNEGLNLLEAMGITLEWKN